MHDWLGSTTGLIDPNGVHRSVYGYAGFGPAWAVDDVASGAQGTRQTFAGAYADPETGLLGLRARVYDPATGTFTTRDPVTDREDTPYTSAYGYVENRPTSRTDPTGRCSFENQVQSWLHPVLLGSDACEAEDRRTEQDRSLPQAVRSLKTGQDELVEGVIAGYANGLSFGLAPDGQPNDNIWFCLGNNFGLIAGTATATMADLGLGLPGESAGSGARTVTSLGAEGLGEAAAAARGPKLLLKIDKKFRFPGAGRSGAKVKNFVGPPNTVARGASHGRIFVTDDQGKVIFDITRDRVKSVVPGRGFVSGKERKRVPTSEELGWINKLWGV
jgi:RHS repeat-associated protein